MINNNKILTVSYGTFSCTLEGFDDSFGTMKAIAEYFRDLAADDRYFGAEPPQPDAEMLARIAQKEISRKVEAREHEGKIVLSAVEAQPSAVKPTVATALLTEKSQDATDEPAEDLAETEAENPADVAQAEAQPTEVEQSDVPAQPDTAETVEPAPKAEAPVQSNNNTAPAVVVEAPVESAPQEDENDIVPGQPDAEVKAFFANAPAETSSQDDAEQTATDIATDAAPSQEPGSIAAKLQRIRAVVAQQDDQKETDDFVEDQHAGNGDAKPANAPQPPQIADAETPEADLSEIDSPEADAPEQAADVMAQARRDIENALEADQQSTLLADEPQPSAIADTPAATAPAEVDTAQDNDEVTAILERVENAQSGDAPNAAVSESDSSDSDIDTLIAEVAADDDVLEENLFEEPEEPVEDDAEQAAPVQDAADAGAARITIAQTKAAQIDEEDASARAPVRHSVKLQPKRAAPAEPETETAPAEQAQAPAPAPRAHVIKVKRADLEAAIQSGELEEYDDEDEAPVKRNLGLDDLAPARTDTTSLSPEEEDDLVRELAALEADMHPKQDPAEAAKLEVISLTEDMRLDDTGETTSTDVQEIEVEDQLEEAEEEAPHEATDDADEMDEAPTEVEAEVEAEAEAEVEADETPAAPVLRRRALPKIDETQESDMSRLMAEAENQMDEPEGATRRDAFSHLRAAVASKKADDAMGTSTDTVEADDAYRNDLADVVRPRRLGRPGQAKARTPRPEAIQTAPLKLVAEQRVDVDNPTPKAPVRPRRVAAVDQVADNESGDFAAFAEEMGASTLPQLLEAAAAYMSFVEGHEQFSRPQLMTKVRQVGIEEGFTREDGLRQFGKLLRSGKIEKIRGGRFTVSEDIGYRPDERAAG